MPSDRFDKPIPPRTMDDSFLQMYNAGFDVSVMIDHCDDIKNRIRIAICPFSHPEMLCIGYGINFDDAFQEVIKLLYHKNVDLDPLYQPIKDCRQRFVAGAYVPMRTDLRKKADQNYLDRMIAELKRD